MIRGTTPKLKFGVPFNPTVCKQIWITFSQDNREIFTIYKDDCTLTSTDITVRLSQRQTLSLSSAYQVQIQIRVAFDGLPDETALASEIITTSVGKLLRDGVIE